MTVDKYLSNYSDYGPLVMRIVLGGLFVWAGWDKISALFSGGHMVVEMLGFAGGAAVGLAWLLGLVEFFGGIMLVLGWKAQWAAAPLAFAMLVAIILTTKGQGFLAMGTWNAWYAFAMSVYFAVSGAGPMSLDNK